MKINKFFLFVFCLSAIGGIFFLADREIKNLDESGITYELSKFIPEDIKDFLKETIFFKSALESKIEVLEKENLLFAQEKISLYQSISTILRNSKAKNIKANLLNTNNIYGKYNLTKFKIEYLSHGKSLFSKASAYIDKYETNIFLVSADGVFSYFDMYDLEGRTLDILTVPSNIDSFIDYEEFYTQSFLGIKDILIQENYLYVTFTNQLEEDCFNVSVLEAKINYDYLTFKKFFFPDECSKRYSIYDTNMHHAGGRLINHEDSNTFILSVGDFGNYEAVQDDKSYFGKIIKINKKNKNYSIISKGHRNPQGLYYDFENNILLSTEHGPYGGDEINIIPLDSTEISNYGWPIVSYGEHNSLGKSEINKKLYERAPLHKPHKKYGFIEPEKYFVPAIGISELVIGPFEDMNGIASKKAIISSMGYKHKGMDEDDFSLHIYDLNLPEKLNEFAKIKVGERIRDLKFIEELDGYLMFLENSPSVAILSNYTASDKQALNTITRSGKEVYLKYCSACHTNGFAGSPLLKDSDEWQSRLTKKGIEKLISNTYRGFKAMPAKGGCNDCSLDEIEKSVNYILEFRDPGPTGG
jgi:cytochrome c5